MTTTIYINILVEVKYIHANKILNFILVKVEKMQEKNDLNFIFG